MFFNLRSWYYSIRSNFWFVPALIALASLVAAPLALQADFHIGGDILTKWLPGPSITQEGARMVLSTVAGSMMTVASLVFSMTLVALSLVSQQLGPRVLQFFMEDTTTKVVLGAFIATFLFALIVLGTVGTGDNGEFVPRFSVFVTGTLAIIAFVLMIYFVHHISTQIQADVIIAKLGQQFAEAADDLLNSSEGNPAALTRDEYEKVSRLDEGSEKEIQFRKTGYLGSINEMACLALATEHDIQIRMLCRPGHFLIEGDSVFSVGPSANINDAIVNELKNTVAINPRRTREQHVEFEINALVEVALRALSPGINDPYTAMACIDHLAEGLVSFLKHGPDMRVLRDEDNAIRVLLYPQEFEHYLNTALHPIRQAAAAMPLVHMRLLQILRELSHFAQADRAKEAIQVHVDAIEQTCMNALAVDHDIELMRREIRTTRSALSGRRQLT